MPRFRGMTPGQPIDEDVLSRARTIAVAAELAASGILDAETLRAIVTEIVARPGGGDVLGGSAGSRWDAGTFDPFGHLAFDTDRPGSEQRGGALDSALDLGDSEEVRLDLDRQDFLAQGGTVQGGDDPKRDRFIERATEEARYAEERERAMDAYLREAEAARHDDPWEQAWDWLVRRLSRSPGPEESTASEKALAARLLARIRSPGVTWGSRFSKRSPAQVNPGPEERSPARGGPPVLLPELDLGAGRRPGAGRAYGGPERTTAELRRGMWGGHGPRPADPTATGMAERIAAVLARLP